MSKNKTSNNANPLRHQKALLRFAFLTAADANR